ncbi:hypothetical protein C8E05_7014 [Rhodococcus wratislaviensis]|uniref:Uncharacterized protein n=1 Tax=Rhodococcus wratislaviensis TaxID=44752 RepID=A0AB38F6U3_RHOWR|nr:hypothetical protein C8E05_7014 [Rhodococcus wratislaviensis]SPZ35402.1 Uncharacterised protein [Rhodococcus wratislaviensis]
MPSTIEVRSRDVRSPSGDPNSCDVGDIFTVYTGSNSAVQPCRAKTHVVYKNESPRNTRLTGFLAHRAAHWSRNPGDGLDVWCGPPPVPAVGSARTPEVGLGARSESSVRIARCTTSRISAQRCPASSLAICPRIRALRSVPQPARRTSPNNGWASRTVRLLPSSVARVMSPCVSASSTAMRCVTRERTSESRGSQRASESTTSTSFGERRPIRAATRSARLAEMIGSPLQIQTPAMFSSLSDAISSSTSCRRYRAFPRDSVQSLRTLRESSCPPNTASRRMVVSSRDRDWRSSRSASLSFQTDVTASGASSPLRTVITTRITCRSRSW